ncbi:MAG: M20/M25/M40 family metallo-hydrolase [Candidatus Rokubacteria bacterium]|nr:M20/M25/M40 family metallo-hydrolase [Candidatus Rokubacteria bacterium]
MGLREDVLAQVDDKALRDLTVDLINIPSPMGGERAVAEYLADRFRAAGLRTWLQEVEPERFNVFGVLEGTGGGPTVMYCGHLDTTFGGDEEGIRDLGPAYQPRASVDGDWIYGMGAYNMKSGLASAVVAVEALARARARLRGDVMLAGVVGETSHAQVSRFQGRRYRGCGVGARFMVTNGITADMAIIPEPTANRISVVSGGYVYAEIATRGNPGATYRRGGETIRPRPAVDAIEKMLPVIAAIKEWAPKYVAATRYKGAEATNVSIIAIEGGLPFRPTKLAPICRLYVEVDTMPGQSHADVVEELKRVLAELRTRDPELGTELQIIQTALGAEVSPDEPVVQSLRAAHREIHGVDAEVTWDGWHADTAALTRAGIPAICYGPQGRARSGGSGYYPREGEQVSVTDLVKGTQVFVLTALDLAMRSRAGLRAGRPSGTVIP